jgi:hypothetical protein
MVADILILSELSLPSPHMSEKHHIETKPRLFQDSSGKDGVMKLTL